MNLFRADGHLAREALCAAVAQVLDEMSRLEVAEHLSFCDGCLERYTALLTDDTLITPMQPLAAPVLSRLRKRAVALVFNRYTTYGAAACLALALWGTGVFASLGSGAMMWENTQPTVAAPRQSIMVQANDFLSEIQRSVNTALGEAIFERKAQAREKAEPKSTARDKQPQ